MVLLLLILPYTLAYFPKYQWTYINHTEVNLYISTDSVFQMLFDPNFNSILTSQIKFEIVDKFNMTTVLKNDPESVQNLTAYGIEIASIGIDLSNLTTMTLFATKVLPKETELRILYDNNVISLTFFFDKDLNKFIYLSVLAIMTLFVILIVTIVIIKEKLKSIRYFRLARRNGLEATSQLFGISNPALEMDV